MEVKDAVPFGHSAFLERKGGGEIKISPPEKNGLAFNQEEKKADSPQSKVDGEEQNGMVEWRQLSEPPEMEED